MQQPPPQPPTPTAPYNFVPFPPEARPAPDGVPSSDRYHAGRFTGVIEIKLETLTPLFIGGTERNGERAFFAPAGSPRIPGSSLRGMVRSLVETLSESAIPGSDIKGVIQSLGEPAPRGHGLPRQMAEALMPTALSGSEHFTHPHEGRGHDLASLTFGFAGSSGAAASRVFFEDLDMKTGRVADRAHELLLGTPNPASYALYFRRSREEKFEFRGRKYYWHRRDQARPPARGGRNPNMLQTIRPTLPGACFGGRVRFENLTTVELGALLTALCLPAGAEHRLGMAKPYGYGSVHVSANLRLDDRIARYRALFTPDHRAWLRPLKQGDAGWFADAFSSWVLGDDTSTDEPWERLWSDRMSDLLTLLHFPGPDHRLTGYKLQTARGALRAPAEIGSLPGGDARPVRPPSLGGPRKLA